MPGAVEIDDADCYRSEPGRQSYPAIRLESV